jgi:photosystem II stability/assembly factor-like uncharacterized protein
MTKLIDLLGAAGTNAGRRVAVPAPVRALLDVLEINQVTLSLCPDACRGDGSGHVDTDALGFFQLDLKPGGPRIPFRFRPRRPTDRAAPPSGRHAVLAGRHRRRRHGPGDPVDLQRPRAPDPARPASPLTPRKAGTGPATTADNPCEEHGMCGTTWTAQTSGVTTTLVAVSFRDYQYGWVVGSDDDGTGGNLGRILATIDGGLTWSPQDPGGSDGLRGVAFTDRANGWAVGDRGTILRTGDGGGTWQRLASGVEVPTSVLTAVAFADPAHGWVGGSLVTGAAILETTDGGATWSDPIPGDGNQVFSGVACVGVCHAWAVGDAGRIFATTDGVTWQQRTSGVTAHLWGVAFADLSYGWAVGDEGTILATTDGGVTWNPQTSGTGVRLYAVAFPTRLDGVAVGGEGTILATSDGGATWTPQGPHVDETLWGVAFPGCAHAWTVGTLGTVQRRD